MKRKAKLVGTMLSLATALSLMAFGVYAALSQNLGVTSNVSFSVESIYVSIQANVVHAGGTITYDHTTSKGQEDIDDKVQGTDLGYFNDGTLGSSLTPAPWAAGALTFDEENPVITYTFTITNNMSDAGQVITASIADVPNLTTQNVETTGVHTIDINPTETGELTVILTLQDFSKAITAAPCNFTVNIAKKVPNPPA